MASWAYSEQLGKNRQGESAPARWSWYHRIARSIARCSVPSLWTVGIREVTLVTLLPPSSHRQCWCGLRDIRRLCTHLVNQRIQRYPQLSPVGIHSCALE